MGHCLWHAQRMGEEALGLGADGLFPRRERRSRVRIWHRRIPGGCVGLQGHGQNMRGLAGRWGLLIRAFCIMDGWALPATVVDNNQQYWMLLQRSKAPTTCRGGKKQ